MTAIVSDLSDTVTVTDLFCGAGGSSTGAVQAGATVRLAANHWALAVQTHSSNHPTTDHDIADISQVEPRRYPSTTILLASPECTTHSLSGGRRHEPNLFNPDGDPRVERSRATMWDVPRFAEVHHYRCVIVENVVEIRRWAPYNAWLEAMRSLGYNHRAVFLNSMVAHPTPQSRDRVYIVFWLADQRAPDLDFRAKAWCPTCEVVVQAWQAWKRPDRGRRLRIPDAGTPRDPGGYGVPRFIRRAWVQAGQGATVGQRRDASGDGSAGAALCGVAVVTKTVMRNH